MYRTLCLHFHILGIKTVLLLLKALRNGVLDVIPLSAFDNLTAEDFRLLLNGCGEVNVQQLTSYTCFNDETGGMKWTWWCNILSQHVCHVIRCDAVLVWRHGVQSYVLRFDLTSFNAMWSYVVWHDLRCDTMWFHEPHLIPRDGRYLKVIVKLPVVSSFEVRCHFKAQDVIESNNISPVFVPRSMIFR